MTLRLDVARRRDVLARWCALAEQRLDTELFESGRWRRYHSERSFLENIQEAKAAVQIWRDLSRGEAAQEASAVNVTWPAPVPAPATLPVQNDELRDGVLHVHPQAPPAPPPELALAAEVVAISAEAPVSVPEAAAPQQIVELTLELDGIQARYPLLRNVF